MKSKIILDYSGTNGKNGDSGNSYSGGTNGINGESARPISIRLFTYNNIITIADKSGFSDVMSLGLSSNSLALLSNGGKGGHGGNGGKGFNGISGSNGFNATQYSSGTSGGNGGNGGNGTDGGNGGQGGNGGSITVNVNYEDTDLLMLIDKHEENFGPGGKGGVGGPGGSGGSGGRGGNSYSWTERIRNNDGTYSYVSNYNSGGSNGIKGADGSPGRNGKDGYNGHLGSYEIQVNQNGEIYSFKEKYNLIAKSFDIIQSDDNVYEPGEEVFIHNLIIENNGLMPTPRFQNIITIISDRSGLSFMPQNSLILPLELFHNNSHIFTDFLRFSVDQFSKPSKEGIPTKIVDVSPDFIVTRVNKNFGVSLTKHIQVRWPVEISVPIAVKAISLSEEAPFAIEIRNISSKSVGLESFHPRKLILKIEKINLDDLDHIDINSEYNPKVAFLDESGSYFDLNISSYEKLLTIEPKTSTKLGGTYIFSDPETPPYTKVRIRTSLLLGDRKGSEAELIQYRNFDIQMAESFLYDESADVIIIVNSAINREEINTWKTKLQALNIKCILWNASLYDGFSYDYSFNGTNFMDLLKRKVVIVLNSPFRNEQNDITTNLKSIPLNQFFVAAQKGISTLFVGNEDRETIANLHLPLINLNQDLLRCYDINKFYKKERISWHRENFTSPTKIEKKSIVTQSDTLKEPLNVEEQQDDTESHEIVKIFKSFSCCNEPSISDMVNEIIQIKNKLQYFFPNRVYHFFYSYKPQKTNGGCMCSKKWYLGEVHIVRGLNLDKEFNNHIAHSIKNSNIPEEAEIFTVLKLLPIEKKLNLLNIATNKDLEILIQAILSDLIEELNIFRKNSWSGLMNKSILTSKLTLLNFFVNYVGYDFEITRIKSAIRMIIINYSICASKITSWNDYIWFNRIRRILRSICENKIETFRVKYFDREEIKLIKSEISNLRKFKDKTDDVFNNYIMPYSVSFSCSFKTRIINTESFDFHKVSEVSIKTDQYKFYDPSSGVYDSINRKNILDNFKKNCYFDVPENWNGETRKEVKEYTKENNLV